MQEPEKICDRVGVVFAGRIIQIGTPYELKRSTSELSVVEVDTPDLPSLLIGKIRDIAEICRVEYKNPILRVTCSHDPELAEQVTRILISSGARIRAINTKEPTLEEAFISLTGGEEEIDHFLESEHAPAR
jgi:ABC-2 type transport system ATP-binding protein